MNRLKQIHNWTLLILVWVFCLICLPFDFLFGTHFGEAIFDFTEDMFFEVEVIKND